MYFLPCIFVYMYKNKRWFPLSSGTYVSLCFFFLSRFPSCARRKTKNWHTSRQTTAVSLMFLPPCDIVCDLLGTFSNADFCEGDGDRKSNLFPVDVLHFGVKPFSLGADVRTVSFPLSTKRECIFCFYALNIYHFFLISFPKETN